MFLIYSSTLITNSTLFIFIDKFYKIDNTKLNTTHFREVVLFVCNNNNNHHQYANIEKIK
jgi:hypothetical protein